MKRLILLIVVAAAAWYGWHHWAGLRGAPTNEVVIENRSGRTLGRVRLSISGQEYPAYDSLYDGKSVTQAFPLNVRDGQFELHWVLQGVMGEPQWTGGMVTAGPVRMRHRLQVGPDNGVIWSSAPIPAETK